MPTNDPPIADVIDDRWRQFNAIFESANDPEVFTGQATSLLARWFRADVWLLLDDAHTEPREQYFLVRDCIRKVHHSPQPRERLQDLQYAHAEVEAGRFMDMLDDD